MSEHLTPEWGVIPSYPRYAVSRAGLVVNLISSSLVSSHRDSYGYIRVTLYNDEGRSTVYVHKLIEEVFADNVRPIPPRYRVIQIVETGERFPTVEECAKAIDTHASNIYKVLRGERQSHKGLTFSVYLDSGVRWS